MWSLPLVFEWSKLHSHSSHDRWKKMDLLSSSLLLLLLGTTRAETTYVVNRKNGDNRRVVEPNPGLWTLCCISQIRGFRGSAKPVVLKEPIGLMWRRVKTPRSVHVLNIQSKPGKKTRNDSTKPYRWWAKALSLRWRCEVESQCALVSMRGWLVCVVKRQPFLSQIMKGCGL